MVFVLEPKRRRFGRKSKILLSVGLVLLAVVVPIYMTVKNLNAPAQGSINQTPPDKTERLDPYAQPAVYRGKYISFTYPAHYKKVPSALTGSYLEVFSLYATDQTGKQIIVGVQKGGLSDNSGISYRRAHPELYIEEPRTRAAITFTSKTLPEKVSFLEHAGLLANVSITSQGDPDLDQDLQTVLSSFSWK